jgi:hypothetical protein
VIVAAPPVTAAYGLSMPPFTRGTSVPAKARPGGKALDANSIDSRLQKTWCVREGKSISELILPWMSPLGQAPRLPHGRKAD